MRTSSRWIASACCLIGAGLCAGPPAPARGQEDRAAAGEPYAMVMSHRVLVRVESVGPDGTIRLVPPFRVPPAAAARWTATEGQYLFVPPEYAPEGFEGVARRPQDQIVRLEVADVGDDRTLTARSGPEAAAALKPGDVGTLVRPGRMTTARIRALPAVLPILKDGDPRAPQALREGIVEKRRADRLSASMNNLKQIALAMHNFRTAYGQFPPAVVYGPDGKPWHSWRVLILPFLDQGKLFNRYDFTQPWDSPKNRELLDEMPAIYRDPQDGDEPGPYTHYAALVGERTAFPPRGSRITIANGTASNELYKGMSMFQVTDGTSNTIAVAPVDPARRIPWTKPEDIAVGPDFPAIGQPGGIFAPSRFGDTRAAPVVFLDGSVRVLSDRIDRATLLALTTCNAGDIVEPSKVLGPPASSQRANQWLHYLYLIRDGRSVSAMIGPAPGP